MNYIGSNRKQKYIICYITKQLILIYNDVTIILDLKLSYITSCQCQSQILIKAILKRN